MNIYLDTKDLTNILERTDPCTADQLNLHLREGGHQLVLSAYSIYEVSAPLSRPISNTNVMSLLNRIEEMPIIFVHPAVNRLELEEALNSFSMGREYRSIYAFVRRFDESVHPNALPTTKVYLNYSLAEIVWDLHCYNGLQGLEGYAGKMKRLFAADRNLQNPPSLKANFLKVIEGNLRRHKLSSPGVSVVDLANWIYENPSRCPSLRLGYEVWHKIVRNKTDRLEDSDMEDFQHLASLPYVDLMTLDRRMHEYVSQAASSLGFDYKKRISRSAKDMLFCL